MKIIKIIKNIFVCAKNYSSIFLTYKSFTEKKTKDIKSKTTLELAHVIKDLKFIENITIFLATADITRSFHYLTEHPINIIRLLFYIVSVSFVLFILFTSYRSFLYHLSKYIKGDPVMCPYYKKTFYFNTNLYSNYDFRPYFNQIKQNLQKNKNIKYYQWVYSFDKNRKQIYKIEFFCVYKIGIKKNILTLNMHEFIYWDKKKRIHSVDKLLECRIEELFLMLNYYLENFPEIFANEKLTQKVSYDDFIAYNLNIGDIRYKIVIVNYKPEWHF